MQKISIDANASYTNLGKNGKIKDVNGVNGYPISFMPGFPDLQDQFNQIGVSHIRLHDIFGPGDLENSAATDNLGSQLLIAVPDEQKKRAAAFVADIMNTRAIFPHANEGMEKHDKSLAASNPNWLPTDYYIRKTMENIDSLNPGMIERNIMFRIGRSNGGGRSVPADFDIYAELVSQAVQRYSADISLSGIPRKVMYWEIWNEPDLWIFWGGNAAQYYEMYEKLARTIKSVDPTALVGGAGIADGEDGTNAYARGLLSYCKDHNVPLDFLSWHYYAHETTDPKGFARCADAQRKNLDRYGFSSAESICLEWNITPFASAANATKVQTAQNATFIAASLITMNKCSVDKAYYYRGDAGFLGLFNDEPNPWNPEYKGFATYAAQAFGLYKEMFGTPHLLSTPDYSSDDLYVLAGRGSNAVNVLVANFRRDLSLAAIDTAPPNNVFYRQNYVDSNRDVSEINDGWGLEHWFGIVKPDVSNDDEKAPSVDAKTDDTPKTDQTGDTPKTDQTDDTGKADPIDEPSTPSPDVLTIKGGISLYVKNLPTSNPILEVRRVANGGNLGVILPPVDNHRVDFVVSGNSIWINDPLAKEYTVSHYSIIW